MPARSLLLPILLLLVAMSSIQGGAALAKGLFPLVGAQGAVALRIGLSALILLALLRPWRGKRLEWRRDAVLLAYGASIGGMNLLFFMALRTIPLGVGVALEFVGPLLLALVMSRRLLDVLWIVLAAGGIWLLLPAQLDPKALDPVGMLLALAAGLVWALYIVFGQKAGALHGSRSVALGMLVAAVLVLPFGVAKAGAALLAPSVLPLGLAVAVLSSALPFYLELRVLTQLPTRTFSILLSLEPALAVLSGLLLLGERLSLLQALAVVLIICASAGVAATSQKPH